MVLMLDSRPGQLTLADMRAGLDRPARIRLDAEDRTAIDASRGAVLDIIAKDRTVYGINTGFGLLASTRITADHLADLQRNLVLSHAAGTGPLLDDRQVRLIMLLKIASLARGYSGVRFEVIEALQRMLDARLYPCIPSKGSVGASGDLAPLAHLSAALIGVGDVRFNGEIMPAADGLGRIGLTPVTLEAKEGLALLNGTQASTALALDGLFAIENVFAAAVVAGALSTDALKGSDVPFDPRIHAVRGHPGQIAAAGLYRKLLAGSSIRDSHRNCPRVQDPYSLRCQPQVMGACLDAMARSADVLRIEANAVTDNPLVFADDGSLDVISGGNFHAEPVAIAADGLALAIAEIASISERRTSLLVDPKMSGLPAFLVKESGLNSGFMIAQVTAAALVSENKTLAHPASVDSIPTSANQEDHVSMATFAARRLADMAGNSAAVVAVELLAAAQGVDFHAPMTTSEPLQRAMTMIRDVAKHWDQDRYMAPDIAAVRALIESGAFVEFAAEALPSTRTAA